MGTCLSRRAFTAGLGAAALAQTPRPNILWITCEDMGPHLRSCGDEYSVTPNLDRLCSRGQLYMNAWSNAPVCAPARTTIISGVYPTSTGSHHMRSHTVMPAGWKMFPGYLREAGYYCSNNEKEDYNLEKPPGTWDESSKKAHWRNRAPGQPFFSVFNLTITHESQIRTRPHTWIHDPAKVRVPAYHPDTPEVRQDWAQYYDNITTMDTQAGQILDALETDGLAQDTIVLFFGDHGSGMPRNKRWPYNSGLNVCIAVSVPEKFKHLAPRGYRPGTKDGRLVGFVDLAPSMLSLAGVPAPSFYQGRAFLGPRETPPRDYSFGFRGRMDERYDCVRSVRNQRYVYVRNYMPHKIYGQHLAYQWETPTTRVWERLYKEGKLNAAQRAYWERKPEEELYDLQADRDEVNNLASSPQHAPVLKELRGALTNHLRRTRDLGFLPEDEIHSRAKGGAPYDIKDYPLDRILAAIQRGGGLRDPDSAVRYWSALHLFQQGRPVPASLLRDPAPAVRIVAAEAHASLDILLDLADARKHGLYVAVQALNAIDALGAKADPVRARVAALPNAPDGIPARVRGDLIGRLKAHIKPL